MTKYLVIFERAEDGGWGAYVPDLPGVVALGADRGEVGDRIQEALAAYASDRESQGLALPEPSHQAGFATAP